MNAPPAAHDPLKETRDALTGEALAVATEAIAVLRRTFAAGEADFDDAVRALPHVHRVLEHVDRMAVANRDTGALPLINFVLVLDPNVRQERPPKPADVVEEASTRTGYSAHIAVPSDAAPLDPLLNFVPSTETPQ